MNLKKIIQEELNNVQEEINNINSNSNAIRIYHGTPFKVNADGIIKNGLQQKGNFKIAGGQDSNAIAGRSYLSKELWNAVRYSFMQPSTLKYGGNVKQNWLKYIQEEPYGYLFVFQSNENELLPDEDAIGAGVSKYLNDGENDFYQKYLNNVNKNLLQQVKGGSFKAFADLGKIIEPQLSKEDVSNVVRNSQTITINKPLIPIEAYQIPKPNIPNDKLGGKFFSTKEQYINYFQKYGKRIK